MSFIVFQMENWIRQQNSWNIDTLIQHGGESVCILIITDWIILLYCQDFIKFLLHFILFKPTHSFKFFISGRKCKLLQNLTFIKQEGLKTEMIIQLSQK